MAPTFFLAPHRTLALGVAAATLLGAPCAHAQVLFESTCDDLPDWNTDGQDDGDCGDWTGGTNHCTTAPVSSGETRTTPAAPSIPNGLRSTMSS